MAYDIIGGKLYDDQDGTPAPASLQKQHENIMAQNRAWAKSHSRDYKFDDDQDKKRPR